MNNMGCPAPVQTTPRSASPFSPMTSNGYGDSALNMCILTGQKLIRSATVRNTPTRKSKHNSADAATHHVNGTLKRPAQGRRSPREEKDLGLQAHLLYSRNDLLLKCSPPLIQSVRVLNTEENAAFKRHGLPPFSR